MPGRWQDGGFTLRSHCAEEINRLMMCIGQSHRHNHVSRPHIESRMNKTGDMKLLQGHFSPFFHFRFIFAVFRVLQLHGRPGSSGFKFDFCAQNPFRSKLIIRFIFAVFRVLQLHGRPGSSGFKFDFCAQNPFRSKLIIHCQHKAWNRNRVPMITSVSIWISVITVDAIILKTGHSFSIASHTKTGISVIIRTLPMYSRTSACSGNLHRICFTG
jgi:hypothetical protein